MNLAKLLISKLKFKKSFQFCQNRFLNNDKFESLLNEDREYLDYSEVHLKLDYAEKCYIIQPHVKWGQQKLKEITPAEQLDEAIALVHSLPEWKVTDTVAVPLETLDQNSLFRSGWMEKLRKTIRHNTNISAVFINRGTLKKAQMQVLEKEFGVPVLDRYRIVMHILKLHAISKNAKLQVALAELHYLRRTTIHEGNFGKMEKEKVKLMFQTREQKLKAAIKELRTERGLLRSRRQKNEYPTVAVVGYTNAGKTSLIKALTGEEKLMPRNQLFATLDVTVHEGLLPSGMKILYVDTVGFISDIPTDLIECFVATLEDAVLSDVILHVEDISSTCFEFKRKHVLRTLEDLAAKTEGKGTLDKIISVGNKCDLVDAEKEFGILKISSKTEVGLDSLRFQLEQEILNNCNMKKIKIRVPAGREETRWLYKNCTVISEEVDKENTESVMMNVIITHTKLQQFKHYFIK